MAELVLQSLYSGVLAGGAYALIALGLVLVFGTMRIINLAHGELVLLAAYVAFTLESKAGLSPLLAVPAALVVVCAAMAIVYVLVSRIRHDRELNSLILTYGVGVILTNATLLAWTADIRSTGSPWLQQGVELGIFLAMRAELVAFAASVLLLTRTWHGRAVRAVSSDRDAARLMGIDPGRTELVSFLAAGVLAAFAGVALYISSVIQPSLGGSLTVKAFIITVLAGVGSVPGVAVGALLLGIVEALTVTFFSSALQELTGMVLFLVVLYVLPSGLFGLKARRG
jgi:branched-chain amino acid transport system permease protein